jgi:3-methyladenine DNA glycosylase/8-oxoguanine DNA glycosylase
MFLLFQLRRADVWPTGDLGVRNGFARVMGWDEAPSAGELELAGIGYRPWRSAVAWYCWRAVEVLTPGG